MKKPAFGVRAAGVVQALVIAFLITQCGPPKRDFAPNAGGAAGQGGVLLTAGTAGRSGGASGRAGSSGGSGGDGPDSSAGDTGTAGVSGTGGGGGSGESGGTSGGSGGATAGPVGNACSVNGDCALGNCIDGVCCESACTGCKACAGKLTGKSDGTCAPVVGGQDPHNQCEDVTATNQCGTDGTCDGLGGCRKVSSSHVCSAASCTGSTFKPVATCDGNGACATPTTENCGVYPCATTGCAKTCMSQADCSGTNYCKITSGTSGTCTAKNTNGTAASSIFECLSNVVADGVCCDMACTGCKACTGAPLTGGAAGQCLNVLAGKIAHSACAASGQVCGLDGTCDGAGACQSTPKQGESCDSASNKCLTGAKCQAGTCAGAVATTCGPPPAKCQQAGVCVPATGQCSYATVPPNTSCDDGNACTQSDVCQGLTCAGSPKPCNPAGQCKQASTCSGGTCSTQQPVQDGVTDPTCAAGKPYCFGGNCVACNVDQQCGLPTPSCSNHTCVCRLPSSTNKLKNPGFDGSFTSWTVGAGENPTLTTDIESCPGSNSVSLPTTEDNPRQCVTLPAGVYYVGGKFKGPPGTGSFVRTKFWAGSNCSGTRLYPDADISLNEVTSDWRLYYTPFDAPAGTVSMSVGLYGIQLNVDQMFLGTAAQY